MSGDKKVDFNQIKENGYRLTLTKKTPKTTGVSFDYMDTLISNSKDGFADEGIFVDEKGDGFTKQERKALGDTFESIHAKKGYSTDFKRMQEGTSFDYTYEEYLELARAAGYVLKEQPAVKEVIQETPAVVEQPKQETAAVVQEESVVAPTKEDEGQDVEVDFDIVTVTDSNGQVISQTTKSKIKEIPQTVTTATVPVKETVVDETPEQVDEKQVPVETSVPFDGTAEEAIQAQLNNDSELAGKTGEERLQILKKRESNLSAQKRELEQTTETYRTKGFLGMFKKTKTRELTAEEIAARQQQAETLDSQLDTVAKNKAYVREVETSYWSGPVSPAHLKDEDGNVVVHHGTYHRVTVKDDTGNERKAARIDSLGQPDEYGYKKMVSKYYSLDVQKVGDPKTGLGTYYQVVPDMNNELKDVK